MRFAQLGDTHLGRSYPTSQRVAAFNEAFKLVIDRILNEELDFVIHTGDFFDKYNPWPSVVKFASKQLFAPHPAWKRISVTNKPIEEIASEIIRIIG